MSVRLGRWGVKYLWGRKETQRMHEGFGCRDCGKAQNIRRKSKTEGRGGNTESVSSGVGLSFGVVF